MSLHAKHEIDRGVVAKMYIGDDITEASVKSLEIVAYDENFATVNVIFGSFGGSMYLTLDRQALDWFNASVTSLLAVWDA